MSKRRESHCLLSRDLTCADSCFDSWINSPASTIKRAVFLFSSSTWRRNKADSSSCCDLADNARAVEQHRLASGANHQIAQETDAQRHDGAPQPVKLECLRNETEDPGQAYRGQSEVIRECAPQAQDCTHRRYRYKDGVDEVERAKNRSKSTVRSKVEHVFAVMKLKFGFVKLRFRGLKKNATQLFAVCALVNLYLARKKLLLLAPA